MRVLLIDDEKELVTTLSERLELRGIESDWALSGEDGLLMLDKNSYDCVLVDLKMPGLGGCRTIEAIKARRPGAKVILLTGHSSPEELDEALTLGAHECLVKPVDMDVLLAQMQACREEKEK